MTTQKPKPRAPFSIEIKKAEYLEKLYMPFIKTGGLFLPNANAKPLSFVTVIIKINIEGWEEDFNVSGIVQFYSPEKSSTLPGIGVAFQKNVANTRLKEKIEDFLKDKEIKNNFTI